MATKKKKKRKKARLADSADKYDLYQRSVQAPEDDVAWLTEIYRSIRKRKPYHLREDFCGTAVMACAWAAQSKKHSSEGFDIAPEPLAWGKANNLDKKAADRVVLHREDVREPGLEPADIRTAQNFSYQVFHTRDVMLDYLRGVHASLSDNGIYVMDLYGGWHAEEEREDEREVDDFIYIWDQKWYAPVTGRQDCAIHFRFSDDSELRDAFVYQWRHWTMPELQELLAQAGFDRVDAYFEQFDEDGDGNGVFEVLDDGHNCESWIAYLVAIK